MPPRKDNPVGSPESHKQRKVDASEKDMAVVEIEGMPKWAKTMQKIMMERTSKEVSRLKGGGGYGKGGGHEGAGGGT